MMNFEGGQEVSEFVWEEMHQAGEEKGSEKESPTPTATAAPKSEAGLLESPKGSYRLEKGPNEFSAWVVSTKDPKQRQLLSTRLPDDSIDRGSCAASPDEEVVTMMREELYPARQPSEVCSIQGKGLVQNNAGKFYGSSTVHPSSRHWIWSLGEWSADSGRLTIGLTWPDSDDVNIFFNTRTNEFERVP